MTDVKIVINGKEFPIYYHILFKIAEDFPDDAHYTDLAKALIDLDIPSITEELVSTLDLDTDTLDDLWQKGDVDLRTHLLKNEVFLKNLTDMQANDIISSNNEVMLKTIAEWCEYLYPDDDDSACRLSGKMADALMANIINSSSPAVRRALMHNSSTPTKFLPSFRECIENGIQKFNNEIISSINIDDVPLLNDLSRKTLKQIANAVEDIESIKAKKAVINFLASHHDPSIRLELAENNAAPTYAFKLLLNDNDADIVQTAKKALTENDDWD